MYYVYDDNPSTGFVALENSIGAYVKTGFGGNGNRQYTGSYSSKYQKINNEHVVDSHFKIMKTPPKYPMMSTIDAGKARTHDASNNGAPKKEDYKVTEPPKQWKQRAQNQQVINPVKSEQQDQQNLQTSHNPVLRGEFSAGKLQEAAPHTMPTTSQQIQPIRPKAVNADYSAQMKQRNQRNQDNVFEAKPNFVQMNVRKAQVADSQKIVKMNNNRQMTSLAVRSQQPQQDNRQRMPTSMMMDKTLHKANAVHDHNKQVMSRVLDDMTQQIADRRHKKGEYRKRDATNKQGFDVFEKSKRSVVSDNMRKYIGKDKSKGNSHRNNMELPRVGSLEESAAMEPKETPYALFYRMNPETLDQQEGFMLLRSMEDNSSNTFNNKNKRLTFDDDFEVASQQKPKKGGNAPKLHKKLKNFASYRKH
ncbi:unnamed protein product [Spodoptera exigua]|nr:unnamed protein product [Spodoptera exigua]